MSGRERIGLGPRWGALFAIGVPAFVGASSATKWIIGGGLETLGQLGPFVLVSLILALVLTAVPLVAFAAIAAGRLTAARIATGVFAVSEILRPVDLASDGRAAPWIAALGVVAAAAPLVFLIVGPERVIRRGEPLFGRIGWGVAAALLLVAMVDVRSGEFAVRYAGYAGVSLAVAFVVAVRAGDRRADVMLGIALGFLPFVVTWVFGPGILASATVEAAADATDPLVTVVAGPIGFILTSPLPERALALVLWGSASVSALVGLRRNRSEPA